MDVSLGDSERHDCVVWFRYVLEFGFPGLLPPRSAAFYLWSWPSYFTSLSLCLLTHKMRTILVFS